MTSEISPDPQSVHEFVEVLYPLLAAIRSERTISPGKIGILHHLSVHGRATTSELATALRVSPQGISLGAKELEGLGFIERVPDSNDRRKTWLVLRPAGKEKLASEVMAGEKRIARAISERLTDTERTILQAALPVLRKIGTDEPRG
ncbi:MarR family winged helix-turn-helix transcriptional regulator [Paeniglutamicibacter terrestris]|uniref:MarR family transcriptional regulator n=1 Tax=Paeniglutamicibacter terrestris TaxID=2723403 RepID=A0ABX1G0P0_9MICC|nr:MarR family transcriptional regulator [Paeniglutamicibacter terrestris]NKG19783.1 MarR family transcriptional regulator [Paeniglutamicibacter terrestris]